MGDSSSPPSNNYLEYRMDYLKCLHRRCLVSRSKGRGGLDEIGCRCEYCKIDIKKFRLWNNQCRHNIRQELKCRARAKQRNQSNSRWMLGYVPYVNNMDQSCIDFLQDKFLLREKTTLKQRNFYRVPKTLYYVRDVPGLRVPIYLNDTIFSSTV